MNMTFKRILSVVLALAMIFALAVSTVGCKGKKENTGSSKDSSKEAARNELLNEIGGASETYVGAVSTESYSTPEIAAEAYVAEEIAGQKEASIVNVVSKGELNDSEIKNANIPDELLDGADAVEKIEVTYSLEDTSDLYSGNNISALSSDNKETVTVYVIKYGADWKYFTPMPVTGSTISKSYYDSVFDVEKYKNCTFESTVSADIKVSAQGMTQEMTMTVKQVIKHADGKVYLEQTSTVGGMGMSESETMCAYIEEVDDILYCYLKDTSGEWYRANIVSIGFSSVEELTPFYDQYLDYTYFTKTNYGFELANENARKYFEQALMGALDGMSGMIDTNTMKLDMYAEYYVSEGVLSGMLVKANVDMTVTGAGSLKETVTTNTKCTNYGTTVIERPNMD